MRPIIFDYNGTLFFDADINEWAWRQTINELSKGTIDFDEIYKEFKSTRNYLFVKNVFKRLGFPLDDDQINYWAKRKETEYYHRFCRENKRKELAPGAEKFLNYLKVLGTDPQKEILPKVNVVGITLCEDISEGKKCSAHTTSRPDPSALVCIPSFECFIPQQGAAGAEGLPTLASPPGRGAELPGGNAGVEVKPP